MQQGNQKTEEEITVELEVNQLIEQNPNALFVQTIFEIRKLK